MFKGTRTHLRTLLAMTFGLLALSSCRNKEINVDVFKASLEVMTKTVYEGEDFEFRVFSNKSFKIESLSMASDPSLVKSIFPAYAPNSVYTIDEKGYQDFIIKEVHIASSHRGTLSMVVSDPETGKKYELTDYYTFYSAANAKLVINNLPASGESVDLDMTVPLVVDGDDFSFSISLKTPSATLKDFDCEFNDGQLKKGMDLDFSDGLPRTFTFPAVSVQEDGYAAPNTLSLTLVDNETGEESTVTANYLKITEFKPEVSLQPSSFRTGESPVVKISSNRNSFKLLEYTGPEWFNVTNGLSQNAEIQLTDVGYATYTVSPVETSASESGTIKFFFKDNHFTLREKEVDVTYSVQAPTAPQDVIVKDAPSSIANGETATLSISTSTEHSTNLFTAEATNGGFLLKTEDSDAGSKKVDIANGKLIVVGTTESGYHSISIYPQGNKSKAKNVTIYVRQDIAIVIDINSANLINQITTENRPCDHFYVNNGDPRYIGWYGYINYIDYSIKNVTINNPDDIQSISLSKNSDASSTINFDVELYCQNPTLKSPYRLWGAEKWAPNAISGSRFGGHTTEKDRFVVLLECTKWCADCGWGFYFIHNEPSLANSSFFSDGSSVTSKVFAKSCKLNSVYRSSSSSTVVNEAKFLRDANNNVQTVTWPSPYNRRSHDTTDSKVGLRIKNASYPQDKYRLTYIVHNYRAQTVEPYWWKSIDLSDQVVEEYK